MPLERRDSDRCSLRARNTRHWAHLRGEMGRRGGGADLVSCILHALPLIQGGSGADPLACEVGFRLLSATSRERERRLEFAAQS